MIKDTKLMDTIVRTYRNQKESLQVPTNFKLYSFSTIEEIQKQKKFVCILYDDFVKKHYCICNLTVDQKSYGTTF